MSAVQQPWGRHSDEAEFGAGKSEFEDNFCPSRAFPDSEDYVASLESKLARLKGKGRDVTAREMLGVLGEARQDHTGRLLSTDPDVAPGATAYLPGEDCSDAPVRSSYLEKRLFPERQALTQEELKYLLEADFLGKSAAAENSTTAERSRASFSSGDSEPNR
ncbi:uncharacterized protein LOC8052709 [Ixodes scapularis]|uniref:uncharacterized protein LOC8052709 n=1 Tax=Ixodes scapularis TaxID=6945 RepID=UPI001A9FF28A|nr:uncharacterized protein LOC8052709 [Ixodes scapularis]